MKKQNKEKRVAVYLRVATHEQVSKDKVTQMETLKNRGDK